MGERVRTAGYLAGALAARTGDEAAGPALLLLGVAATGSAAPGAALLAALTAAAAVGGPVVGALLDRAARPGRTIAVGLLGYAAGMAVAGAALGRVPTPFVLGAALVAGLAVPALSGGWTAQLPHVVPPARVARVATLDAMTFGAAGLVGPALTGLMATAAGAPAAVALAAALVALAACAALTLPAAPPRPRDSVADPEGPARRAAAATGARGFAREVGDGVRAVVAVPALLRVTVVSAVAIAGTGAMVVAAPLVGARVLGGAENGAFLLAGSAACALVANLVCARWPPRARPEAVVLACVAAQAAGMAAAATGGLDAVLIGTAVAGAAEGPLLTAVFAVRHRDAPPRLRAQVFTTGASAKIGALAAVTAAAGPLADRSPFLCLALAAALHVAAALLHVLLGGHRTRPHTAGRTTAA
jgi:MFS family permease